MVMDSNILVKIDFGKWARRTTTQIIYFPQTIGGNCYDIFINNYLRLDCTKKRSL
jgi:hypothetical protein